MKIKVETRQGTGLMGGPLANVKIEAADYEAGAATVTALNVLAALGFGDGSVSDGDDDSVGTTSEATTSEATTEYGPRRARRHTPAMPGDAVRLTFGDRSTRLFIDTGEDYYSPVIRGKFDAPLRLPYDDDRFVTASVVAALGDDTLGLRDGEE